MDRVGNVVDVLQDLRHGQCEPPQNVQRRLEVGRAKGAQDVQGHSAGGEGLRQRQVQLARSLQDQGQRLHGVVRAERALRNQKRGTHTEPGTSRYTAYEARVVIVTFCGEAVEFNQYFQEEVIGTRTPYDFSE